MNDDQYRSAALNIDNSYIVQAPAGSGKTELLTQRYLKLLANCNNPEDVVAMTFTNKAVFELSERVLSSLELAQGIRPKQQHKQVTYDLACLVIARAKQQGWQLTQMPQRLKIHTIDGLSSLINENYPTATQVITPRIMAQQWERDRAYRVAAEQTLKLINDSEYQPIIAQLLLYLDNNVERFYSLVINMLAKRDQWLPRLYKDGVFSVDILQNSAKEIITAHLEGLKKQAEALFDNNFFNILSANTQAKYNKITQLPGAKITDLSVWHDICTLCLTQQDSWRKSVNKNHGFDVKSKQQKDEFLQLLTKFSTNEELRQMLAQLKLLPDVEFTNNESEILELIAKVLKLCVAQLKLFFNSEKAQDFIETALNANDALNDNIGVSDIALFLDYKIEHILIDEFQDTSSSQFTLIQGLVCNWQPGDGRTIFIVGDPMQSIYGFRESQVGLFLRVKKTGIANIALKSLQLSANFRSIKSIVEANNRFFKQIFPVKNDIYKGAINYVAAKAAINTVDDMAVSFYPLATNADAQEAQLILDIIAQTSMQNADAEIAILVRNRSHLNDIYSTLQRHNIEFEAPDIIALKEHMFTKDLLTLTAAILHLGDKLAWLSLLRAPWCGMLLEDLLLLADNKDMVIYQQLNDAKLLLKLSADGQQRAQHMICAMSDVINNQGRFSFVELLNQCINNLINDKYLSIQESNIKDNFLQIVNECEASQQLNITTIKAMLAGLYAPTISAPIKLMTIHQAKGLEFDTVIIPGLGKRARYNTAPIIHMHDFANSALLIAPIKAASAKNDSNTYNYLKFIGAQQSKFETMRLLYVAMTRAKNKLYLLGAISKSGKANSNSLLNLLMPFYQNDFADIEHGDEVELAIDLLPEKLKRVNNLAKIKPINKINLQKFNYDNEFEVLFKSALGTLLHKYYEDNSFNPSDDNIKLRLLEIGVAPNGLNYAVGHIKELLTKTRNDKLFNWLFARRDSTLVEAEFADGDKIIIIDRLFIAADVLWIIDFKSAAVNASELLDEFIQRQKKQHSKQLLHYKKILSKIYDNQIQCALYLPAEQQLIKIDD